MSLLRLPPLLPAPSHPPVALPDGRTVAYPAAHSLVLLHRPAADGALAYRTSLAFPSRPSAAIPIGLDIPGSSALPAAFRPPPLGPVVVDPAGERLASSAGRRVCVWERKPYEDPTNGWGPRRSSLEQEAAQGGTWVVHSTLRLPGSASGDDSEEEAVLGLALSNDRLAVQTAETLYYYTTDLTSPAPLWTLLWDLPLRPTSVSAHSPLPSSLDSAASDGQRSKVVAASSSAHGVGQPDCFVQPAISPNGLHLAFCPPQAASTPTSSRPSPFARVTSEAQANVRLLTLHPDGCLDRTSSPRAPGPSSHSRAQQHPRQPGQALAFGLHGRRTVTGLEWWKDGPSSSSSSSGGAKPAGAGAQVLLTSTASVGGRRAAGLATVHFHTAVLDDPGWFALVHTISAPTADGALLALPTAAPRPGPAEKQRFVPAREGAVGAIDVTGLRSSSSKLVTSSASSSSAASSGPSSASTAPKLPAEGRSRKASILGASGWTTALDASTLVHTAIGGVPVATQLPAASSSTSNSGPSAPPAPTAHAAVRQGSIQHLHRTPNGRSVLVEGTAEMVVLSLTSAASSSKRGEWLPRARWPREQGEVLWALFARGRSVVSWDQDRREVGVRYLRPRACDDDDDSGTVKVDRGDEMLAPTAVTLLPGLPKDETLTTLIGLSNVDDGLSPSSLTPAHSLVLGASASGRVYTWSLVRSDGPVGEPSHEPVVELLSTFDLPAPAGEPDGSPIVDILPVDPMAWRSSVVDWSGTGPSGESDGVPRPLQDLLLVVRQGGQLEYWSPWEGGFARGMVWTLGGCVKTGKTLTGGAAAADGGSSSSSRRRVRVRCSSAKKTALVCWRRDDGEAGAWRQELTIWDSKSSEFYSGLEYSASYPADSPVLDLDWTSTPDKTSVLAVGFRDHVLLLCEQRMSYLTAADGERGGSASYWAPLLTVPVSTLTPHAIQDSIWLSEGTLAVGSDATLFLHARDIRYPSAERAAGAARAKGRDLFESVALHNAPLVDWHPQLLLQCLLWNKLDLVKKIITQLYLSIEAALNSGRDELDWTPIETESFFRTAANEASTLPSAASGNGARNGQARYNGLFGDTADGDAADENGNEFGRRLIERLLEHLSGPFPLAVTKHEREHLRILVQTVLEIDDLQRSLDLNGLRYLISLRFHINWRTRSTPVSSAAPSVTDTATATEAGSGGHRHARLSFRNVVWAFHSQSQQILLTAATEACAERKMRWKDAKTLGVFMWLTNHESLKAQMEVVARNEYMQGDDRDPTTCSLYYFALGKVKLVQGLWKQAAWHPEQKIMLKFLGNDFSLERWQTAALKNAFALMSKRRFEYAAAFFILGGSLKDAVNVCVRQLDDFQLAIALARIVEGDDGLVLKSVLRSTVLPRVFEGGHRWLGTWAFWMLKRRDLAVRILITPLADLRNDLDFEVAFIADPHDDDPSLALLFSQIKSLTLQTAKGSSEVPERTEFNFVLHNARVFTRMGCHVLGLDLVRSWAFDRPERMSRAPSPAVTPTAVRTPAATPFEPSADDLFSLDGGSAFSSFARTAKSPPRHQRRPSSFLRDGRRGSTMVIDMDLPPSELPTRAPSPEPKIRAARSVSPLPETPVPPESPAARQTGLGSLMKAAKQDVKQGAMEFDMSAFGF